METQLRHTSHARGQRDESAHHRKQAAEKYSDAAMACEKVVGPIQLMPAYQQIRTVFFDQRAAAIITDCIGDGGPKVAAHINWNLPVCTRYPENGMMISEGKGMQADSIAIKAMIPKYPPPEITAIINALSAAMILLVMNDSR